MGRTSVVCLAVFLFLFAAAHFIPALTLIVALGAIVEGILILLGQ